VEVDHHSEKNGNRGGNEGKEKILDLSSHLS
jgi:hypothetical protein